MKQKKSMRGLNKMYRLRRIIAHTKETTSQTEIHKLVIDTTESFIVTDNEYQRLLDIQEGYEYEYLDLQYDNILCLDRHPSIIENVVTNSNFVNNYQQNINDKFFISYIVERVD